MIYLNGFLFCGVVCAIAQFIYDSTKLSPGHITTLFVIIGCLLEFFSIYDFFILHCGAGAMLPIISFGHSLAHAGFIGAEQQGILGIFSHVFDLTSSGISFAIFLAFIIGVIFKPKA